MEPLPKRPRSEFDATASIPALRHNPADGRDFGRSFSSTGKPKPCMKFFSTSGCPFGESCHFLHYVPGGLSSLGLAPVASLTTTSSPAPQRKPTVPVGDPSITVTGYKTKLCNKFNTAEGCRFGDKCHFAHGEGDLRPANNLSRGNKRPISNGTLLGAAPPTFGNGTSSHSNPAGYPPPPVKAPNFPPESFVQPDQLGVPVHNDGSVTQSSGPVTENVPVY